MTIFLDASALVAMLAHEPEAQPFSRCVESDDDRITSALALWEATRGLSGARGVSCEEARDMISDYVRDFSVRVVPIGRLEADAAIDAHVRFGKGNHPARLNFGDCFSYACAKLHADAILFKGDDFAETDLPDATLA